MDLLEKSRMDKLPAWARRELLALRGAAKLTLTTLDEFVMSDLVPAAHVRKERKALRKALRIKGGR